MINREGFWVSYVQDLRDLELVWMRKSQMYKHLHSAVLVWIPIIQSLVTFGFEELVRSPMYGLS